MGYIDAHCHLADPRFATQLDSVLARAQARGIDAFIQGGVGPDDWAQQLKLAERYPGVFFPCFGLHPWWVASHSDQESDEALALLPSFLDRGIAVGELGLDYARRGGGPVDYIRQERIFRAQLELACTQGRPLVLHIVRAHPQALNILKEYRSRGLRGIVHSFAAGSEVAHSYLDLGLILSLGGTAVRKEGFETFKRAVVKLPPEAFVLETDSPDQNPEGWPPPGWPGEYNEPSSLLEIAQAIAKLRGEKAETILRRSQRILQQVFELPGVP